MSYKDFHDDIQQNQLKSIYLFYGPERLMIDRMVEQCRMRCLSDMALDFNFVVSEGDNLSFGQVYNMVEMLPVMDQRRVVLIKNPNFLSKDLWLDGQVKQFLEFPSDPNCTTTTILWADGVDKRKKLVKEIGKIGRIIAFDRLDEIACGKWLKQEAKRLDMDMSIGVAQHLVQRSGYLHQETEVDLYQMLSWLQRMEGLFKGQALTVAHVDELLDQSVEGNVFKWVDAVFEGQHKLSYLQQQALLEQGEAPLKLLFMLHRNLRQMYKVKLMLGEGYSQTTISEQMGLKAFVVKKSVQQGTRLDNQSFLDLMDQMVQADQWMKSSAMRPDLILDFAVGQIIAHTQGANR